MKTFIQQYDIFPDKVDPRLRFSLAPKISKIDYYYEPDKDVSTQGAGRLKRRFEIEFYCLIDQRALFEGEVKCIDAFLSQEPLSYYDANSLSVYSEVDKTNTQQVNDVTYDVVNYLESSTNKKLEGLTYFTSFEPYQTFNRSQTKFKNLDSLTDEAAFGKRLIYETYEINRTNFQRRELTARQRKLNLYESYANALLGNVNESKKAENSSVNYQDVFKRHYNSLILKGIDPLYYFQDAEKTQSVTEFFKGIAKIDKPMTAFEKFRKDVTDFANKEIKKLKSESVVGIRKTFISKRIERIKTKVIIDEDMINQLTSFGNNLIIFATGYNGVKLDRTSYEVNLSGLISNLRYSEPNLDYSVVSTRNRYGKVITTIQNESQKNYLNLCVHTKSMNYNLHPALLRFNVTDGSVFVNRGKNRVITDGRGARSQDFSPLLGTSFPIFHRFTPYDRSEKLANTKSTYVPGKRVPKKLLSCAFYPIIKKGTAGSSPFINIVVKNVSPEVQRFRVVKRNVTNGFSRSKFYQLRDENFKLQPDVRCTEGEGNFAEEQQYSIRDYDIHDGSVYEYSVILFDASGNKSMVNNTSVEKFMDPAQVVNLRAINVTSGETSEDEDNVESPSQGYHEISFDVFFDMQEQSVDKILNSVFDDKYQLFLEQFKDLSDASALIKGVKVSRINTVTGVTENVGNFKASRTLANDQQTEGKEQFSKVKIVARQNLYCNYIYKLEPYVVPPTHVLANVTAAIQKSTLRNIAKNTLIGKIGSYTAASKALASSPSAGLGKKVSSVGSNYASVRPRRGAISSPTSLLEKTGNDIFSDGLTGDVSYVEVGSPLENPIGKSSFIQRGVVKKREVFEIENTSDVTFIKKKYFLVDILTQGLDRFVDFFIVFKRQNLEEELTIDGAIHSVDRYGGTNSYRYATRCDGAIGLIQYYILAVGKDGSLGTLEEVASHTVSELL